MTMKQTIIGDTIKVTWVDSGVTPTDIRASVFNGAETLVGSVTMQASGNGHYFGLITLPNTPGYYVAETLATIDAYPYKRRLRVEAITGEVD